MDSEIQSVSVWLCGPFGCELSPDEMSSLIFHTRASTLCRATGAWETCRCVASPTGPAHTPKHTRAHVHTQTLHKHSNNVLWCALSLRLPGNSSSFCSSNTKSTSCSSKSRWGQFACVCARGSIHVYVSFELYMYLCVYECDLMCVYKGHNFVIVIVAAFLCSAISIWGLNQRRLIVALPPLTQTHTYTHNLCNHFKVVSLLVKIRSRVLARTVCMV